MKDPSAAPVADLSDDGAPRANEEKLLRPDLASADLASADGEDNGRNKQFFGINIVQKAIVKIQEGVARFVSATTVHDREGNPIIKYMEDAQMWLELPKICDIGAVVALRMELCLSSNLKGARRLDDAA